MYNAVKTSGAIETSIDLNNIPNKAYGFLIGGKEVFKFKINTEKTSNKCECCINNIKFRAIVEENKNIIGEFDTTFCNELEMFNPSVSGCSYFKKLEVVL